MVLPYYYVNISAKRIKVTNVKKINFLANNVAQIAKLAFHFKADSVLSICEQRLQNYLEIPLINRLLLAETFSFNKLIVII